MVRVLRPCPGSTTTGRCLSGILTQPRCPEMRLILADCVGYDIHPLGRCGAAISGQNTIFGVVRRNPRRPRSACILADRQTCLVPGRRSIYQYPQPLQSAPWVTCPPPCGICYARVHHTSRVVYRWWGFPGVIMIKVVNVLLPSASEPAHARVHPPIRPVHNTVAATMCAPLSIYHPQSELASSRPG